MALEIRRTDALLISGILILIILLTVTVVFIFRLENRTDVREESAYIDQIDSYINDGYIQEAVKSILKVSKKELSAASHIRLLKRAWIISMNEQYREAVPAGFFETAAERAYRSFPAREDISWIYMYALLRGEKHSEAVSIFSGSGPDESLWNDLSNEIHLYMEPRSGEKAGGLLELSRESGSDKFFEMYDLTGGPGFFLDAVLLLMEAGEVRRAYDLVQENKPKILSPRFRLFLAYDSGQWNTALMIIRQNPQLLPVKEQQMIKADLLMRTGKYDEALKVYGLMFEDETGPDWIAGHNLIFLDLRDNGVLDAKISDDVIKKSSMLSTETDGETGNVSPVIMDIAGLLMAYGQTGAVQSLLSGFDSGTIRSDEISLIQESNRSTVNPERYSSLLWRLASAEESSYYAIYLGWFMLGMEDFSGLQNLVDNSRKKHGQQAWSDFYQGIVLLYQKKYEQAAEAFCDSYKREAHWCSAYNAAVSLLAAGKTEAAMEQLELSELALAEEEPASAAAQIEILIKRAEIYIQNGNYGSADSILQEIERRDPDNFQAAVFRGMIIKK